jgi:hypothetical protein
MAVWLSRHSEQPFKLGISGNTRARVRRQKHGRIEINGRIQIGDYRTSHGYVLEVSRPPSKCAQERFA